MVRIAKEDKIGMNYAQDSLALCYNIHCFIEEHIKYFKIWIAHEIYNRSISNSFFI